MGAKEDGEVIFRGRHVMMGYMYNEKATKETIDSEGWLHSGDIGTNEEGYLKITGRKKEILITAAGENVAPVLLEDEIKKQLPCVSNAMVIGDRKKYLTVFLYLKTKKMGRRSNGSWVNRNSSAATRSRMLKVRRSTKLIWTRDLQGRTRTPFLGRRTSRSGPSCR